MPLARPNHLPGHYYHFFNRGAHRLAIFLDGVNYRFVIRKLRTLCRSLSLKPIAYCLLPNHYHFLIKQEGDHPAGLLPRRIFNSYSKAYNQRYYHNGTLFEGNYKVRWVNDDSYLIHLCRYIHANPVVHGIVDSVDDWPYSDYQQWIQNWIKSSIDRSFITTRFDSPEDYYTSIADYIAGESMPETIRKHLRDWKEKVS